MVEAATVGVNVERELAAEDGKEVEGSGWLFSAG